MTNKDLSILTELKNYSLDSKLLLAQNVSSMLMGGACVGIENVSKTGVTPIEIEIFATYSIIFDEHSSVKIDSAAFIRIINAIRSYVKDGNAQDFGKRLFSSIMVQQISFQTPIVQRLYKYNYFFNYHDDKFSMKTAFEKAFGVYDDYCVFAMLVYMATSDELRKCIGINNAKLFIEKAFALDKVVKTLSITNEDFKKEILDFYKGDKEELFNGLKLNSVYPIIETESNKYIPNPYLVIDAVTSSLLNRLTENNEKLRSLFGKNVVEAYLYAMCEELSFASNVSREFPYKTAANNTVLSPDVILESGDSVAFFDTKAKTPKVGIRNIELNSYNDDLRIYAEDFSQLINQYFNLKQGRLSVNKRYELHNIFFIGVVLEDSYIDRKDMIEFALKNYKANHISEDDETFIRSNIMILSLSEIEKYLLRNINIFDYLTKRRDDKETWYNFNLPSDNIDGGFVKSFDKYFETLFQKTKYYLPN